MSCTGVSTYVNDEFKFIGKFCWFMCLPVWMRVPVSEKQVMKNRNFHIAVQSNDLVFDDANLLRKCF